MAFPTIPTVAAGRVLTTNQLNTTATRTFPNLSGLTKNSGDLLIAIIVAYQTSTGTNAAFSGWTSGWTEFHDSATSTTLAIGMAYKWSDGTETGTISVTQAGTITGDASMILLSIPGAHASTPPEAGSRASGTSSAANPAAFNPSGWDAEDTLWISVLGSGMTSGTGSWTATGTAAPTNYSNRVDTNASDTSTVGDVEAAVAFRQLNAASEDVGTAGVDTSNARNAAVVIAVRPKPPTSTATAEISLESYGEPSARTNHSIKVRARTTSGSTGVIIAALYEGATNRSGDLTSAALTNSLADYTLAIPDTSAANITDYSNLSIRFWGYDSAGNALVFEVSEIYLELPEATGPSTFYGVTSTVVTFGKAVSGISSKKTAIAEISLASHGTPSQRTNHSIKVKARTTSGSTGVIRAALYEGSTNRSGDLSSSLLNTTLSEYTLVISDSAAATITDYSNLSIRFWGFDGSGNALVFEVAEIYLSLPVASGTTYYGVIVAPFTFTKAVLGQRRTTSQIVAPFTFVKAVLGQRRTTSQITAPFTFTKSVLGQRRTTSQIVASFTFTKNVSGKLGAFGSVVRPFTFVKDISAKRTTFSQIVAPFTFVKVVSGKLTTFGQIVAPFTFVKVVSGKLGTFGVIIRPFTFTKSVSATKKTFGQIVAPFTFVKNAVGFKTTFGQIVRPFTFVKDVIGQRKTFGQIVAPFTFGKTVSGIGIVINKISASFTFVKDVN